MKGLVEFTADDGLRVVAEVDEDDPGFVRAGSGDFIAKSSASLSEALDVLRGTAKAVVEKIDDLSRRPSEVEVEMGLKLNAKAGAVLTSVGGECHIKLKLLWK